MDVGLDQAVAVTDPYGHHGVHGDPMGWQVAGDGNVIQQQLAGKPQKGKCVFTA